MSDEIVVLLVTSLATQPPKNCSLWLVCWTGGETDERIDIVLFCATG